MIKDTITFLDKLYNMRQTTWEILAQPWAKTGESCADGKPSVSLVKGFVDPTKTIDIAWQNDYKSLGDSSIVGSVTKGVSRVWDMARGVRMAKDATGLDDLLGGIANSKQGTLMGNIAEFANDAIDNPLGILDGTDFAKKYLPTNSDGNVDISTGDALINGLSEVPYYSGASCKITIPTLQLRYYHLMDGKTTVKQLVTRLNERFMGKTRSLVGQSQGMKGDVFALVGPPSGYVVGKMGNINYEDYLKGTFLLRMGKLELPNLICENVQYSFSQQRVMNYSENDIPFVTDDYLYVDIQINLKPAVLYTRSTIENILAYNSTITPSWMK